MFLFVDMVYSKYCADLSSEINLTENPRLVFINLCNWEPICSLENLYRFHNIIENTMSRLI